MLCYAMLRYGMQKSGVDIMEGEEIKGMITSCSLNFNGVSCNAAERKMGHGGGKSAH